MGDTVGCPSRAASCPARGGDGENRNPKGEIDQAKHLVDQKSTIEQDDSKTRYGYDIFDDSLMMAFGGHWLTKKADWAISKALATRLALFTYTPISRILPNTRAQNGHSCTR